MTWFGRARRPRPNVRRQAAWPAAHRRPVRRVRHIVRAVWGGTALLLGAWTAVQLYGLAGSLVAGWFELQEVRVTGLRTVTREEILGRLQIEPRATLLSVSPNQLEERVAAHPWIRTVAVSRLPLHALAVHVIERRPAALLKAPSSTLLVDEDGAVLAMLSARAEEGYPDLPVVVGIDPRRLLLGEAGPRQAARQGIRLAGLLAGSGEGRPEVDVSDPEHAIAYVNGMRVRFGAAPLEEQWERYRAVESARRPGAGRGSPEIDLRFSDKVIVREREQLS